MRINDFKFKSVLKASVFVTAIVLLSAVASFGQQSVNLTAAPAGITLPDGVGVPMWGFSCGTAVAGSTASCAPLNPKSTGGLLGAVAVVNVGAGYTSVPTVVITPAAGNAPTTAATAVAEIQNGQVVSVSVTNPGAGYTSAPTVAITGGGATTSAMATAALWWSPVVITVPSGQALSINLTNNLYSSLLTGTATTPVNPIPTSVVILGQVGGGLGAAPTTTLSPDHSLAQGCVTWFIANIPPGTPCSTNTVGAVPPTQGPRVQSMATEVTSVVSGSTALPTVLTWSALRPGTYLLESGTHPSIQVPMGLVGMLVVTCPVGAAAGTCSAANPSTTLGTAYPGAAATTNTAAIPAVTYSAEVPLEFSEIDPVQNTAVNAAVNTSGFLETTVWDGHTGACGDPSSTAYHTCYPPAVNYTPFYYLINGVAFNKTNVTASIFPTIPAAPATGTATLVRLVNAGLRMHVPSLVNSQTTGFNGAGTSATVNGFALIAEDGNPVPGVLAPGAATAPAAPRVQTHVFMPASKTFDLMVNSIATGGADLPIYDRELSLSGNSTERDAGMLAYIGVTGSVLPNGATAGSGVFAGAQAVADTYNSLVAGQTFSITDASKGVIANDINVYGVALNSAVAVTGGTVNLAASGTFTFTPNAGSSSGSFGYCANGTTTICTTVTLGGTNLSGNPTAITQNYTAKTSTFIKIPSPGLLRGNTDPSNLPLTVVIPATAITGVTLDANGGFTASITSGTTLTFQYTVQNSQGRTATGTVNVTYPTPSNLAVTVVDAVAYNNCNLASACIAGLSPLTDYRWIIEEDKTFWVDPNCTTNASVTAPGCPTVVGPTGQSTLPLFATNFHTSSMDFVAQGCTGPLSCEGGQTMLDTRPACTAPGVPAGCSATAGQHIGAVCDVGNGACRPDPTGAGYTVVLPGSVHLDPTKRYYISVLPGDAANPFPAYTGAPGCSTTTGAQGSNPCGHTMSGAPIPPACNILTTGCTSASTVAFAPVRVLSSPTPLPTGKLSVVVFEDDFPLNGEQDGGGGSQIVAPQEPGLGGFNLVVWDTFGDLNEVTGQDTYDAFNQPLSNALAGTIDPSTNLDACPISPEITANVAGPGGAGNTPQSQTGIMGMIVTCPKYESDNQTLSPLAGQALIANLMQDKFIVQAYPGADRIARGEEWLQTNTLDGQHPHDAFIRIGEPSYFQEYGPAGYHVAIGFVNPAIINARHDAVCAGAFGAVGACTGTVKGQVNVQRFSRIPDERLYPSGSRDAFAWTQCWVSLGDPDAEDFMFTKCDANGNFQFSNVPGGNWRVTIGDQWNDQIIDGLSTPANVTPGQTLNMGNIGVQQWQSNVYTRTFIDDNKNGIPDAGEIGIPLIYARVYYRDGHSAVPLTTDFNGVASFNETFPLFNWYVVEADSTRYKTTGIHTVYDAGGPADGSTYCGPANGARACGTSTAYHFMANTYEAVPLPADLSVPGAVYCALADCTAEAPGFAAGTAKPSFATASTGRIDPPWVNAEGWAGITGHSNWIDFGKAPYATCPPACATVTTTAPGSTTPTTAQVGENGGIHGFVAYAATRPFDDASQMVQQPWEPNVPRVTLNLYQEGFAADGVTPTLTMVDTTTSSSWDDWAQGFYPSSTATAGTGQTSAQKPYMSCPGQGLAPVASGTQPPNADLFYYTLFDQPNYLDVYNAQHNGGTLHTLPYNSQFKCYDAMKVANQLQPAVYDGAYSFPSSLGVDPTTGKLLAVKGTTNGVASSMNGTNCTICVGNPDSTDHYRFGAPMLPPGMYVVEVIMPPGYEVYKEEDKNLLIGDNYIAPVTQQFSGLGGDIFIMPDQASVASLYDQSGAGYNPTNYQNATTASGLADELSGVPGFPGFQDPVWPCVGEMRVVPDYLSLFPQALETAPFAGAVRPLCDRKEVTLPSQMSVRAHFDIFTSTHIAGKFTGVITDDFTSEFDPFSPQFGEKFSPPNMPVATRDWLGNEISRVYSDHFGIYDGLTYSSWEVNPPNITGYSPSMMVQCMNDSGPILDTRSTIVNSAGATVTNPTYGQMIIDPLFNPAYSNFCYENPFMPGLSTYNDTPVVPTQAFVGAGYNNTDCAYPDTTPAIAEVDGTGIGPYVTAAGSTLTIMALGDQMVNNYGYGGPSATVAPFNATKVNRHYGFGTTRGTVTIGGVAATTGTWTDTTITVTVPTGVPACSIQQQVQYHGLPALCGQLVITAANGKQSIDTVTVTVGGKAPTHVAANQTIQGAIDSAAPGDLIIVDPTCKTGTGTATQLVPCTTAGATKTSATHTEMIIMWKPVRLQGVGAATTIINANAEPAGKYLDPWRRHINCLFGLTLQGAPSGNTTPYDPAGTYHCPETTWQYWSGQGQTVNVSTGAVTTGSNPQIDRLPLEATQGWIASLNGNIAELLQEPTLMGAFEGAGITVLGKGVEFHGQDPWNDGTEPGAFPATSTLLTSVVAHPEGVLNAVPATTGGLQVGDANPLCHTGTYNSTTGAFTITSQTNPYPSNFMCNPSRIDGLTVTNSSQGGGGIFAHGWAHFLEVGNNRIYNNAGTLTGGVSVGQGEFPIAVIQGSTTNSAPGSCSNGTGFVTNEHLPYCLQLHTNVHNNYITNNSSLGDELFSGTLSGGGGATLCTGNDYYKFNYNWVCGNIASGEGGGLVHLGEIQNGTIQHNSFLFNQSSNPTIPTNGGGVVVMGTADTDPVCPGVSDTDCPPGLSDGTGHGLLIDANLIQGNSADSGSGGGIRLQQVNGTEVATFSAQPQYWNDVTISNNIIVNNMAGWDGAGISLQDALNVSIVNNTIMHNDTLASSGVITNSIGTPLASAPAGNCTMAGPTGASTASCPQSAGVTSTPNSSLMTAALAGLTVTCPPGHSGCRSFSNPILYGDVISQNRSFFVGISAAGTGNLNQQNMVSLYSALTTTAAPTQTATGACPSGVTYWDLGVRGDTSPSGGSGFALVPVNSLVSSGSYTGNGNSTANPTVVAQYCNGSRVPPECTATDGCGGLNGFGVPPGINDAVTPNPRFTLIPSATVDEGNNWINVSWGPLSMTSPAVNSGTGSTGTGNWGSGPLLGNYSITATSPAANFIACNNSNAVGQGCTVTFPAAGGQAAFSILLPRTDFFGHPRPDPGTTGSVKHVDAGAVEVH